jgi:hypothetical protein
MHKNFFVGLDLGQSQDYTAIVILEKVGMVDEGGIPDYSRSATLYYHLRHIQRFQLGTPYPVVVEQVKDMMAHDALKGQAYLVVDATGVGAPVVDLLRQAGLFPVAIAITGGDSSRYEEGMWRVPKRDLVSTLQVLLQSERLKVAKFLPEAVTLVNELLAFRVKITNLAHDVYGVWREGVHDDLVLATAIACWYGERISGSTMAPVSIPKKSLWRDETSGPSWAHWRGL